LCGGLVGEIQTKGRFDGLRFAGRLEMGVEDEIVTGIGARVARTYPVGDQ
jgi:hypothetical protein